MSEYFSAAYLEGVTVLLRTVQNFAYMVVSVVVGFYYIKTINHVRERGNYSMISVLPLLMKPTVILMLIITYTGWTEIVGGMVHAIPEYMKGSYEEDNAEIRSQFVNENGEQVDPWLHYQQLAAKIRNQKGNQIQLLVTKTIEEQGVLQEKMESAANATEREALQKQFDELGSRTMGEAQKLADESSSIIGDAIRNSVIQMFNWLVDGSYFLIILIMQKIQEALLAFIMCTGVIALLWSLIPGRESSFDTWLTYFFSVQFWSVSLMIINIFYNASIVGNIKEMEGLLNAMAEGKPVNSDFFSLTVDYVANCISYIILFLMVPSLSMIYIAKNGGSEMFGKFIQQSSAGSSAISGAGKQIGRTTAKMFGKF